MLKIDNFDFCSALNASASINPLLAEVFKIIREMEPSAIHPCPYTQLIVVNKTVNIEHLSNIMPNGDYRAVSNFTAKNGDILVTEEFLCSIISSEKNSFG